jgi:hypothetical protein
MVEIVRGFRSPRDDAFRLFSYLLSPNDERFREAVYFFRKAKWILKDGSRTNKYSKINSSFDLTQYHDKCMNRSFFEKYSQATRDITTVSIVVRLLKSLCVIDFKIGPEELLNFLSEPSITKAKYLYSVVFRKKAMNQSMATRYLVSKKLISKTISDYRDVLHLCAAWKICDPLLGFNRFEKSMDRRFDIRGKLGLVSLISENYLQFLSENYEQKRGKGREKIQDINKAYRFIYPSGDGDMSSLVSAAGIYPEGRIVEYIRGYTPELDFKNNEILDAIKQ